MKNHPPSPDTIHVYVFQLFAIKLVKGDEIVRACNRHSNKTVTLRKHVIKHKHLRKWMVKFLSKSLSRGDKIAQVNSIRITKSYQTTSLLKAVVIHDDQEQFSICSPEAEKSTVRVFQMLHFKNFDDSSQLIAFNK